MKGPPANVLPWSPFWIASATLLAHEDGANRQPAGQRFGRREQIGLEFAAFRAVAAALLCAITLMRPQRTRAADTTLYLVEDQQGVMLVRQHAQTGQKLGRCRMNAAFALDRFHNDRTDPIVHLGAGALQVVEFGKAYARHQWPERILVLGAGRRRQGADRATVKSIGKGQNICFGLAADGTPVAAGKLECPFVGFSTAVTVVHLVGKAGLTEQLAPVGHGAPYDTGC